MIECDTPVLLILDSVNISYATGATNMAIFSTRTPARCLLLFTEGPVILFDYFGCEHLSRDLLSIDQVRPGRGLCFTSSGGQVETAALGLSNEIADLVSEFVGDERRLALDRFPCPVTDALRAMGVKLEQQLLVTETGTECMSQYGFDQNFRG